LDAPQTLSEKLQDPDIIRKAAEKSNEDQRNLIEEEPQTEKWGELIKKFMDILHKYPSHPPMKGSENGINLVTIDKLVELFEAQSSTYEEKLKEIVGEHNARILNEYQLQGLGDERILYSVIDKATKDTAAQFIEKEK